MFHTYYQLKDRTLFRHYAFFILLMLLVALLLNGCGGPMPMRFAPEQEVVEKEMPLAEANDVDAESESQAPAQYSKLPPSSVAEQSTAAQRLLHYSADVTLLVSQLNKAIENAMHVAETYQGYVERIDGNSVIMQVPAQRFDEALAAAEAMGKVLEKRVATDDISDAYYDSELRLKLAKQSRERLLQLLEKAVKEDDKFELLKQLEKVSLEIRRIETGLEALKKKVRYSTIVVHFKLLQNYADPNSINEVPGMRWISSLANFSDSSCDNHKLQFDVPQDMLRIEKIDYWRVESADEVVFQTCQRDNQPRGDSHFWIKAIAFRMQQRFSQISELQQGEFSLLRLASQQKDAPVFYIGVVAKGDQLAWFEIKFPSSDTEQKHKAAIFKVIEEKSVYVDLS